MCEHEKHFKFYAIETVTAIQQKYYKFRFLNFTMIFRVSVLNTHCRRSQLEALDSDPHCISHFGFTGTHGQLRSSGSS